MESSKLLIIPRLDNLKEYIELAKEYKCGFEYNEFFSPAVLDDDKKQEEIISTYKDAKDMPEYTTLHGAFLDVNVVSSDKEIFKASDLRVRQSIEAARHIGARAVVFHTNYIANFNQEAYRDNWVLDNVVYWKSILSEYEDIDIYIENMFDMDWELISRLGEAMKDEPRFGICFDYAHAHVFGDESRIEEWVKALAPYVKHLHINDNDFISDLHLALSDGNIDWKKFKTFYGECFSEASILIEVSDIDKARRSLGYLSNL